jgi:hypothetical protein
MLDCEYCDKEFDNETELHIHWGEEHEDELNSHQQEKVKKAEREKDKQRQRKKAKRKEYRNYALMGVLLIGLVAGGAALAPKLSFLSGGSGNLGATGSAHYHADFSVAIEGEEVDFSQSRYQVVSNKAHVEGGNGDVVHAHATGAHFRFFLRTLGFDYNATYLKTPNEEYYENGKQVRMFVNTAGDWREIEPKDFRFETGDRILLTYGNYTEEEISDLQSAVTSQSDSL